ncbi:MAG: glycosyltransferase family 2 protein [Solirubrobacteraceae bacterium]|nr:glycosyltransferase family 2 protein [Solirubrobacteraceae bacterium]
MTAAGVTVIVPTVGRSDMLGDALVAIAACAPPPAELLVIDQSENGTAQRVLDERGVAGRVIAMRQAGIAAALNVAMQAATHDRVMVTHDDCLVAPDWIEVASELLDEAPDALWTGRVLPDVPDGEDPSRVPSTIDHPEPVDYTGRVETGVLYPANMAVRREGVLSLGGFDERFTLAAEDNDFCLRWMLAGRSVRYTPRLTVWHRDWRSPEDLQRIYRQYQLAHGAFLAKYLRLHHPLAPGLVIGTVRWALRGTARRVLRRTGVDETTASLTHIPLGFLRGWRPMRPVRDRWIS